MRVNYFYSLSSVCSLQSPDRTSTDVELVDGAAIGAGQTLCVHSPRVSTFLHKLRHGRHLLRSYGDVYRGCYQVRGLMLKGKI